MSTTHWIEFIGDRSVKIENGQSIMAASLAAGIAHYHACGGQGKCSTCRILIEDGEVFLSPDNEKETALRRRFQIPRNIRLACQTFVTGSPVMVHRIIRDETDIELYIDGASQTDLQNIGEERELALFFLDIRNFTPFMQNYLAFDVIHVVRRLFTLFRKSIEAFAGQIIETAGDGLYAAFGFETDPETAVANATQAGFLIQSELEKFNEDYLLKYFRHQFQVGMGVHVGNTIIGNIGIGVNNNLTVMGLAVNIASRLQSATKELNKSFLISDAAYRLLKDQPSSIKSKVTLKGIKHPVIAHSIGKPYQV